MRRLLCALSVLLGSACLASAQSLDDLNIQIHGYATQGFLYTTQNNIFTTDSSDGSPAWTEAVVNVGAQPSAKLRVGVQGRFFLLGNYGNDLVLDWAALDYKVNERFGVRAGKVKTPSALFNEVQDIDPSYMWSLLPQSVYPLPSRNTYLSHYGGVVYGTLKLGDKLGKLEYRGFGGERIVPSDDGGFTVLNELGLAFPNGFGGTLEGGTLHWRTPVPGLTVGASDVHDNHWKSREMVGFGALSGWAATPPTDQIYYYAQYERRKWMGAFEYRRFPLNPALILPGAPVTYTIFDYRSWYGMATYKVTDKLSAGLYQSQYFDRQAALGPARYQKDWALSARYDFNQYLYAKAEQHFIDGTQLNYDMDLNPDGLKPDTRLTILKIGVSF